jgi:DNA-binding transcriptional ArsR family regulator
VEELFGNPTAEKILIYLAVNPDSYAQELSDELSLPLFGVQRQLARLEGGGVLSRRPRGRMKFYSLNPRAPYTPDLRKLLLTMLSYLPASEKKRFEPRRNRPRRADKPA